MDGRNFSKTAIVPTTAVNHHVAKESLTRSFPMQSEVELQSAANKTRRDSTQIFNHSRHISLSLSVRLCGDTSLPGHHYSRSLASRSFSFLLIPILSLRAFWNDLERCDCDNDISTRAADIGDPCCRGRVTTRYDSKQVLGLIYYFCARRVK